MTGTIAYLLLGSNIGDRLHNIDQALMLVSQLPRTEMIQHSRIIETMPLEYNRQPNFLNAIVKIKTNLDPSQLLDSLHDIETRLGRRRDIPKGPRIIDCDILLYGNVIESTPALVLPHPQVYTRWFVPALLLDIDDTIQDPITLKPLKEVVSCHQ